MPDCYIATIMQLDAPDSDQGTVLRQRAYVTRNQLETAVNNLISDPVVLAAFAAWDGEGDLKIGPTANNRIVIIHAVPLRRMIRDLGDQSLVDRIDAANGVYDAQLRADVVAAFEAKYNIG